MNSEVEQDAAEKLLDDVWSLQYMAPGMLSMTSVQHAFMPFKQILLGAAIVHMVAALMTL